MGYQPISEYGIVGNDDRCALVDSKGSIDWCCFPSVDGPSVFGRLLDAELGGHFAVEPTGSYDSHQSYVDRSNVLETVFETSSGQATLTDFMPIGDPDGGGDYQRAVYRRIRCDEGTVGVAADFKPRFDYGRAETTVDVDADHVTASGGGDRITLQVNGPLQLSPTRGRAAGTTTLEAGEAVWFVLQYDHFAPRSVEECRTVEDLTVAYWRNWVADVEQAVATIVGDDPWFDEVLRSALVLKLLINEGTGAIYAAVTTSLPESYGGTSNWDYRYNWIRDAKFTVQALSNLGRETEVHDYFEWFRSICHEQPGDVQPVYDVHGGTAVDEQRLEHLTGYRFSAPVRIGNAASEQRQLDVYGTIVQTLYETVFEDEHLDQDDWESVRGLVDHVCDVWDETGNGIWEFRDEPKHYVHSKLLCWVALDRGIRLADHLDRDVDIGAWHQERSAVRDAIEEQGYSESAGSFVQHFDTDETLDATCLLLPIYGFLPPEDPRIRNTIDRVEEELLTESGLVYRTKGSDVPPEGRGTFLFCSFWLVDALVIADRVDEAREIFESVLEQVEEPYLLSERIAPGTGEYLGNYPQAFSHIGLINSAIYLASASADRTLERDPLDEEQVDPIFKP